MIVSFAIRNLSVLSYALGFTLWHYRANVDTLHSIFVSAAPRAEIGKNGFFDPAAHMLAPGDMILVSAIDGGALLFVTDTDGGVKTEKMAG